MLVLTRKAGQKIILHTSDGPIEITYNGEKFGGGRLAIDAPKEVLVLREEVKRDDGKVRLAEGRE